MTKSQIVEERSETAASSTSSGRSGNYGGPLTPLDNAHYLLEWRPLPLSKENGRNVHTLRLVRCDSLSAGVRGVRGKIQQQLIMGWI